MPVITDCLFPDFENLHKAGLVALPESPAAKNGPPVEIAVFNSMPAKPRTAADIARLLGATHRPIHLTFLKPAVPEPCELEHIANLERHCPDKATAHHAHVAQYKTLEEMRGQSFHGIVLTGMPFNHRPLESLTYWSEWQEIFRNPQRYGATIAICLAAMGAAKHFYGIERTLLPQKISGVYPQDIREPNDPLLNNIVYFDDTPISRRSMLETAKFETTPVQVLVSSAAGGASLLRLRPDLIGLTTHPEYKPDTLAFEYKRDSEAFARDPQANPPPSLPENYFIGDNPESGWKEARWSSVCHQLGMNLIREMEAQVQRKDIRVTSTRHPARRVSAQVA